MLWLASAPGALAGQALVQRVAEVEDGVARFAYEIKPEVEICHQGIRIGERRMWWRTRRWGEEATGCRYGTAEVELRVASGLVREVEIVRRPGDLTRDAVDLGEVSAGEAATYLLSLARGGARAGAAKEAILPAMLADADEVWRDLMEVARDRTVARDVRKTALFWLGQEAADAATEGLADVAMDEDEDQEVRDAAVFALSQRPDDEAVPILMELATTAEHAKTRKTAMFWLAQSGDERVVDFFEEILTGRRGGG